MARLNESARDVTERVGTAGRCGAPLSVVYTCLKACMFVYVCVFFTHSASTLPLKLHETAQSSRISTMFVSLAVVIVGKYRALCPLNVSQVKTPLVDF